MSKNSDLVLEWVFPCVNSLRAEVEADYGSEKAIPGTMSTQGSNGGQDVWYSSSCNDCGSPYRPRHLSLPATVSRRGCGSPSAREIERSVSTGAGFSRSG